MFSRPLLVTACLAALVPLSLTACGTTDTPSVASRPDLLGFRSAALDTAYVGEEYRQAVAVTGGVAPYRVRLVGGQLPQGLRLDGGSPVITGTPTAALSSTFTLEVVDANLSVRRQDFSLTVAAPPLTDIEAALPPTEIRGETRIPLRLRGGRMVRALHYTWALPAGVKVLRVEAGSVLKDMAKIDMAKAALPKRAPTLQPAFQKALPLAAPPLATPPLARLSPGEKQAAVIQPAVTQPAVIQPATLQSAAAPVQPASVQPSLKWAQQGQQLVLDMTLTGPASSKAPVALVTLAPAGRAPFTLTPPVAGKDSQIRALDAAGAVLRDTLTEAAKPSLPKPDAKQGQGTGASASRQSASPLLNSPLLTPAITGPAPAQPVAAPSAPGTP